MKWQRRSCAQIEEQAIAWINEALGWFQDKVLTMDQRLQLSELEKYVKNRRLRVKRLQKLHNEARDQVVQALSTGLGAQCA